jgi:bacterial/archaeal transporter family-2 protein
MPILSFLLLALLGVVAGISLATQAAVNAHLGKSLDSASAAAFVSYLGGTIVMGLVLLLGDAVGIGLPTLGTSVFTRAPWWAWSGGFLGSIYVMISILLVPRLGTATVLSLFVLGQMLASVTFDNFGLFGLTPRAADLGRVLGAGLVVLGVLLMRR